MNSQGVIFYKLDKHNKLQLLLITKNSLLEDIGGTSQICEEISNKTNFKIDFINSTDFKYNYELVNTKNNHTIFLVRASPDIELLNNDDFGKYEVAGINTLIKRSIIWMSVDKFKSYLNSNLINPRIKLYSLLSKFNIIQSELQTEEVMRQIKKCVFYR